MLKYFIKYYINNDRFAQKVFCQFTISNSLKVQFMKLKTVIDSPMPFALNGEILNFLTPSTWMPVDCRRSGYISKGGDQRFVAWSRK